MLIGRGCGWGSVRKKKEVLGDVVWQNKDNLYLTSS
jgi:hypothetical protein